ncbi:MAG TPA: hypothetical protein VFH68_21000 [Polyangia bacterium]|nr:hypothetical protein [Polyangia bacterium]
MKQLGFAVGLVLVLALGPIALVTTSRAFAQGAVRDQSGALTATQTDSSKGWFERKFAGSYVELSNYVGSGTFYASGYHDPYVSTALYLKPVFKLGTKRDLALNARLYLETEYTAPDNPQARRFYPLDPWIWLTARNLHTWERSKIRLSGLVRLVIPMSYESRYANLLFGTAVGGSATRDFELGSANAQGKRWGLNLSLGSVFTKNIHSSVLRGNHPGDTTGCRTAQALPTVSGGDSPTASGSDRCGGPLNTSFGLMTSMSATLSRDPWSFSATLILINQFRYAVPVDAFAATDVPRGRDDLTWGLLSVGYEISAHLGVGAGVSTYQPALDSRYRYPRIPFFDLSGGANANNYTQLFVNVNGTL